MPWLLRSLKSCATLSCVSWLACEDRTDGEKRHGFKEDAMSEQTIEILGKAMHYVDYGSGKPIVLVHGNTGSSRWYHRVMDLPGHWTIAPDLPNFGCSEAIAVADIDVYADHLGAFIDALKLDKPIIVGHSLGGAVVMSLAARRPELAKALVLIDGAAPSGLKTPEAHYPAIELYKTNRDFMRKGLAAVTPMLKDEEFLDELANDAMLMAPHAFAGNARALERFDYSGRAGAFKGPVLVLWGRLDIIISEAMALETADAYPGGSLKLLEGVGHSVMVEDPPRFKKLLSEFAAGVE
ncbi:MAG TPA: alpha/beta hydrolase [Spirochaetaceae bacterium]|nr:alpha/beta hydrolase [Spirochaetaceae bacterium]